MAGRSLIGVAVGIAVVFSVWQWTPLFTVSALLLVVAAIVFGCEVAQGRLASPTALYCLLTIVHFAIPGLLLAVGFYFFVTDQNRASADVAQIYVLLSFLAFVLGDQIVARNRRVAFQKSPSTAWYPQAVVAVVILLLIVGWSVRLYVIEQQGYLQTARVTQGELEGPFYALVRMVELFPQYALYVLSVFRWFSGGSCTKSRWTVLLVTVFAGELFYWLPTGRKEEVVLTVIVPLVLRYMGIGVLPSRWMVVSLGFSGVTFFVLSHYYRALIGAAGITGFSVEMAVRTLSDADFLSLATDEPAQIVLLNRLSLLEPVSACFRLVDSGEWRLMLGASYAQALLALIPRVVWPEKPDLHMGFEFGYAGGFSSTYDMTSSVSVTFIGESYLNLAWFGVVPMLAMGAFFGFFHRMATSGPMRANWALAYAAVLPTLLYIGGTFALYFGGLVKLVPFVLLLGLVLSRKPRGSASLSRGSSA